MTYDNTNSGTLGKNRKPKSDRSPQYTGKINLKGVDFWVSAWIREDFETDKSYFSMMLNAKNDDSNKGNGKLAKDDNCRGRQPEYRGDVEIDAGVFDIVAWVRQSRDGNKFLSIKATPEGESQYDAGRAVPKQEQYQDAEEINRRNQLAALAEREQQMHAQQTKSATMDFDDDIPF